MTKKICIHCNKYKHTSAFCKKSNTKDKLNSSCRECSSAKYKIYRRDNIIIIKKKNKIYYLANKEKIKLKTRKWALKNKDRCRLIRKRHANNLKIKLIKFYSNNTNKCLCCGEDKLPFLTISHMNNDGAVHRKLMKKSGITFYKWLIRNNFPTNLNLAVECWNCNCGKSRNNGVCPHKEELK